VPELPILEPLLAAGLPGKCRTEALEPCGLSRFQPNPRRATLTVRPATRQDERTIQRKTVEAIPAGRGQPVPALLLGVPAPSDLVPPFALVIARMSPCTRSVGFLYAFFAARGRAGGSPCLLMCSTPEDDPPRIPEATAPSQGGRRAPIRQRSLRR